MSCIYLDIEEATHSLDKKVCSPKDGGGYGLRDLRTWNKARLVANTRKARHFMNQIDSPHLPYPSEPMDLEG